MAVYGRNKERWNPTKIKSKVSKNNTHELIKLNDVYQQSGKLFFWMNIDSIDGINIRGVKNISSDDKRIVDYQSISIILIS